MSPISPLSHLTLFLFFFFLNKTRLHYAIPDASSLLIKVLYFEFTSRNYVFRNLSNSQSHSVNTPLVSLSFFFVSVTSMKVRRVSATVWGYY